MLLEYVSIYSNHIMETIMDTVKYLESLASMAHQNASMGAKQFADGEGMTLHANRRNFDGLARATLTSEIYYSDYTDVPMF